ncbi:MAG: acetolactate synthase large subunit, partial [Lachnospiraceae bacterium]
MVRPVSTTIQQSDMEAAIRLIEKAKKPYIFVGGGAILSEASQALTEFAHRIHSPVADSLMGKGAFSGTDE